MRRRRLALAALAALALTLTGCGLEREAGESRSERIDRLYAECITAGGSFEYNESLPYWQCVMPPSGTGEK